MNIANSKKKSVIYMDFLFLFFLKKLKILTTNIPLKTKQNLSFNNFLSELTKLLEVEENNQEWC